MATDLRLNVLAGLCTGNLKLAANTFSISRHLMLLSRWRREIGSRWAPHSFGWVGIRGTSGGPHPQSERQAPSSTAFRPTICSR